jgi:hypothetical protein
MKIFLVAESHLLCVFMDSKEPKFSFQKYKSPLSNWDSGGAFIEDAHDNEQRLLRKRSESQRHLPRSAKIRNSTITRPANVFSETLCIDLFSACFPHESRLSDHVSSKMRGSLSGSIQDKNKALLPFCTNNSIMQLCCQSFTVSKLSLSISLFLTSVPTPRSKASDRASQAEHKGRRRRRRSTVCQCPSVCV